MCTIHVAIDFLILAYVFVTDINVEHMLLLYVCTCIPTLCICIQLTTRALSRTYVCTYVRSIYVQYCCVKGTNGVFLCIRTTEGHASFRGKYFSTVCVSNLCFHELLSSFAIPVH